MELLQVAEFIKLLAAIEILHEARHAEAPWDEKTQRVLEAVDDVLGCCEFKD